MTELTAGDRVPSEPLQQPVGPGRLRVARRALVIGLIALGSIFPIAVAVLVQTIRCGRAAGARRGYRGVARLLERLGPTFVKFGQIMSTRRDALPLAFCDELAVLHDAVTPMTERQVRTALTTAYGVGPNIRFYYDQLELVASGSIASVFHAAWHDGRDVAVKLQRPGIASRMEADLALMTAMVKLAEKLPKCRDVPLGDLTAYVATAILGQLDFAREAQNLSRIGAALRTIPGVLVPDVVAEGGRPGCIVMQFIPGLSADNIAGHPAEVRRRMALTTLIATYQMMFVEGFVHCDLHPGNLYVTKRGEVVILDAGYSVQLPDRVRHLIAEFFTQLSRGNGRRCAEIVIESAVRIKSGTDLDGFIRAVETLVESSTGPSAKGFEMMVFGNALFDLQRDHSLYAESDFAFPLMSLAIIEGTVRALSPDVDFRELGRLDASFSTAMSCGMMTEVPASLPGYLPAGAVSPRSTSVGAASGAPS
jgi:ubiquinone biosynthesis protein